MEDEEPGKAYKPARRELVDLFRLAFERRHRLDEDLESLLKSAIPLGVLTDIITHALGLPSAAKHELLAEPKVDRRVKLLRSLLRRIIDDVEMALTFPPNFSAN